MSIDVSLVVPRFRETEAEIFPLLASVAGQLGIDLCDVEVLVVTDGGGEEALSEGFLSLFPALHVRQVVLPENVGPGVVRQVGIDMARGRWLMFADADDCLHNVGAVQSLLEAAEGAGCDLCNSVWVEETRDPATGRMVYVRHDDDWTWMHGKLIRAAYLRETGIRHHPDLRVHEDTYILSLATALTPRIAHSDAVTYVWKYREPSITRRNGGAYTYDSMPTFVRSCMEAMEALRGRASADTLRYKVVQLVLYVYYVTARADWDAHADWREATEQELARRMRGWWGVWDAAPPEFVSGVLAQERARSCDRAERETVWQWVARLRGASQPCPNSTGNGAAGAPSGGETPARASAGAPGRPRAHDGVARPCPLSWGRAAACPKKS